MYLAHLEKLNRTRLADVLVEEGVLDRARVEEAQAEQDSSGKQLGQILIEGEVISDYDLAKIVVTHYSLPYLDVTSYSTRREVVELLPLEFRQKWAIQPLDSFGSILTLAVSEIPAPEQIEEIVDATHLTPILFIAARRAVLNMIEEEKKRSASRPGAKPAAKHATASHPAPAAAAATAPPKTGPVHVAAPAAAAPAAPEPLLPDFDLPTVSMKLAGATPAIRPTPVKGGSVAAKPPAAAAGPGGALNWMDAAAKPGADPAAKATKFQRPAGGAAHPPAASAPARQGAPGGPGGLPAKGPAPAAPAKPATPAAGAWQSIFDTADESVKKPK